MSSVTTDFPETMAFLPLRSYVEVSGNALGKVDCLPPQWGVPSRNI